MHVITETDMLTEDGAGNVVIDKHANIENIINKSKFENTNVLIKKDKNNKLYCRRIQ